MVVLICLVWKSGNLFSGCPVSLTAECIKKLATWILSFCTLGRTCITSWKLLQWLQRALTRPVGCCLVNIYPLVESRCPQTPYGISRYNMAQHRSLITSLNEVIIRSSRQTFPSIMVSAQVLSYIEPGEASGQNTWLQPISSVAEPVS